MDYEGPEDVLHDIGRLIPGYFSKEQKDNPKPDLASYFKNGYAANVSGRYRNPPEATTETLSTLTLGQIIYHSGKLSMRSSGLVAMYPTHGSLHLGPEVIESLGLSETDRVKISSATGFVEMSFRVDNSLPVGQCFFPEHFSDPVLQNLIPCITDAVTGVPYFKTGSIKVRKA